MVHSPDDVGATKPCKSSTVKPSSHAATKKAASMGTDMRKLDMDCAVIMATQCPHRDMGADACSES